METVLLSLILVTVTLLAIAYALWKRATAAQKMSGLPRAKVVYEDMRSALPPEGPLISEERRLVGKPDYLLDDGEYIIPVEVKSAPLPRSGNPYPGHVLQLAAYCLLVEDVYGKRPPYGYIRYRDKMVRVPYTDEMRSLLLEALSAMQAAATASTVPRSHQEPWRCAKCGLAYACGRERLM